jgi:hypothetical protein
MTYWAMALFFFLCVAAVYPVVIADDDDKDNLMARILPFQGVIGVLALVSGFVSLMAGGDRLGIISYIVICTEIVLGGVLAYVWLATILSDGDDIVANPIEEVMAPAGIIGIALTALWIAQLTNI